jgi:hypothetical protein
MPRSPRIGHDDRVGTAGFEPASSCSQSRRGGQTPLHPVEPPERFKLPTSWFEARRSHSLSYEGSETRVNTDGQIRTDTGQGLGLVPLPLGYVGGKVELEGVEPSRATVQGSPAARSTTPYEPTEEESNLRLPGFNRALEPSQPSVVKDRGEGVEPSLPRSERGRLPISGSPSEISFPAFQSSSYLPAVGRSVPAGISRPARSGGHRSPRLRVPAPHGLLHCAGPPKQRLGSRSAPRRIRTPSPNLEGGSCGGPRKRAARWAALNLELRCPHRRRYVSAAPNSGLREAYVGMLRRRRDVSTACGCTSLHNASSFARRCLAGMCLISSGFTVGLQNDEGRPGIPGSPSARTVCRAV